MPGVSNPTKGVRPQFVADVPILYVSRGLPETFDTLEDVKDAIRAATWDLVTTSVPGTVLVGALTEDGAEYTAAQNKRERRDMNGFAGFVRMDVNHSVKFTTNNVNALIKELAFGITGVEDENGVTTYYSDGSELTEWLVICATSTRKNPTGDTPGEWENLYIVGLAVPDNDVTMKIARTEDQAFEVTMRFLGDPFDAAQQIQGPQTEPETPPGP